MPGCDIQMSRSCSCTFDSQLSDCCTHQTAQQETVQQHDSLWYCPLLEEVNLEHNKLTSVPRAFFRVDACPSLRKLNASHNELEKVGSEVWSSPCLTELNLSYNCITEVGFTSISRSASQSTSVSASPVPEGESVCPRSSRVSSSGSTADTHQSVFTPVGRSVEPVMVPNKFNSPFQTSVPVARVSHWSGKLRVRVETEKNEEESGKSSSKLCQITELNLSHNRLEHVPEGLACVVPQLDKLDLSHNKIRSIPCIGYLPAGQWLFTEVSYSWPI